jgi:N-acetylmuramoyl-L-alanine amidase
VQWCPGTAAGILLGILMSAGAIWPQAPQTSTPPADALVLASDLRLRVVSGRSLEVEVRPATGEGYAEIAERVCGSRDRGSALEAFNGGAGVSPARFVRVPLALLSNDYRSLAIRTLFPRDHVRGEDWIHFAKSGLLPTYDEGLWQVAEWFTGRGENFEAIRIVNGLSSPELASGQMIGIPGAMLHPALRPRPTSNDGTLEYSEDDRGPYAGYRLRPGEALYSSVVVRFTGRTSADDVNAVAAEIASRSGIRDLRDIPVGFLVKLDYDLLEPEYLPPGHPRRREAEAARDELVAALAREPLATTRGGLEGVVVILDPGHGGRDLGTMAHGIWEHDYVYDVACRLKALLESRSHARVVMTLEDKQTGCVPSRGDRLTANRQGTILTDPPFLAREDGESVIAVNLRWYLANSVFRKVTGDGTKPDRIVFLSLHADARHPALRGLMVYVPGVPLTAGTYGSNSATYRRFREVRERPTVQIPHRERVRSEAVSRKLAVSLVDAFRKESLPVQVHKPVRDRIIRGRRTFVPAVLRGNQVPGKVLVELLNLTNAEDAALLARAAERERLASALLRGLYGYFGETPPPASNPP